MENSIYIFMENLKCAKMSKALVNQIMYIAQVERYDSSELQTLIVNSDKKKKKNEKKGGKGERHSQVCRFIFVFYNSRINIKTLIKYLKLQTVPLLSLCIF